MFGAATCHYSLELKGIRANWALTPVTANALARLERASYLIYTAFEHLSKWHASSLHAFMRLL